LLDESFAGCTIEAVQACITDIGSYSFGTGSDFVASNAAGGSSSRISPHSVF
jgi:hypothetical protein